MADHTLTPAQAAAIDATVDRVRADRADAGIMGARYDGACEQIVALEDEVLRLRADYDEATAELAQELAEERTLTSRLRLAWTSARRGRAQARDDLDRAVLAVRELDDAYHIARILVGLPTVEASNRMTITREQADADEAAAEIAALRTQLATTRPDRAVDRLAADARPNAGGGR